MSSGVVSSLTITSWNLQGSRGVDVERVAAYVRRIGTDVLALQEVQRAQARSLARALDAATLDWGFKHWPGSERPEGAALIGVTGDVRGVRSRAITYPWRLWSFRRRIVQTGHISGPAGEVGPTTVPGPVRLLNVHLSPHAEGAEQRSREVRGILAALGSPDRSVPTVVAGDFNAGPEDEPSRLMAAAGFTAPETLNTNWRGRPADRVPEQRIDHVWLSPELTVAEAVVPRHGEDGFGEFPELSDHLPVTVRLTASGNP